MKKIHLKYWKTLLGAEKSTSYDAVYVERGLHLLYIMRSVHIIKYCLVNLQIVWMIKRIGFGM